MTGKRSIFLYLVLTIYVTCINANVVVKTSSGRVQGVEVPSIIQNEKYFSFMGIPYAQPPVGPLRFMPPQPHQGWSDVLNAKKEKKPCAQFFTPVRANAEYGFYGSEDCLHLSIHTPKPETGTNLAVIVFLYNEHFKSSYNGSKDYGPDFFMKEDVIIVTVNHRLASLGFLSFQDDILPGNNALRDIIIALKWIKENINNFGGDPNKVALMGSSYGAGLVDILLQSPKAKGLFSSAILQSGTSWSSIYYSGLPPKERAIQFSIELEEEARTSSYLLKRLSAIDAQKLVESEHLSVHADEARAIQRGILPFGPVIEHDHPDAVITRLPEDGPIDINVPVMIGYNSREALEMCARYLALPQYLTFADRDFLFLFPTRTNYHFKINDNIYRRAEWDIKSHYFEEGYVKISKPGEYVTYMTDVTTFYPIDYTVRKYTNESKADVFYYMFDYSGELNWRKQNTLKNAKTIEGTWGATHGDELCYMFVCRPIRKAYVKALEEEDNEEIQVLRSMVRMWANFARTGNPTPTGEEFTWKPASKENKECLVISDTLEIKSKLHDDAVTFWDKFIVKYKGMAKDGIVKDEKDEL
ncbi:hypothetical protein O0L34_g7871 [Tuta absoluta]|nr:hypothetical protein O0L34_g7871 [Tuta absoluta]